VAHADPASDWPAALLAVKATIVCRSSTGERTIGAREFFVDTFTTAIEPTEVLTEIRIPRRVRGSAGAYTKLERRTGDFATVGVAAIVRLTPDGKIGSSGIGVTGVSETPFAATDAEKVLDGQKPTDDLFRRAGEAAAAMSHPAGDVRGPAEYKRAMTAEMTVRSLRAAVERAMAS